MKKFSLITVLFLFSLSTNAKFSSAPLQNTPQPTSRSTSKPPVWNTFSGCMKEFSDQSFCELNSAGPELSWFSNDVCMSQINKSSVCNRFNGIKTNFKSTADCNEIYHSNYICSIFTGTPLPKDEEVGWRTWETCMKKINNQDLCAKTMVLIETNSTVAIYQPLQKCINRTGNLDKCLQENPIPKNFAIYQPLQDCINKPRDVFDCLNQFPPPLNLAQGKTRIQLTNRQKCSEKISQQSTCDDLVSNYEQITNQQQRNTAEAKPLTVPATQTAPTR